MQYSGDGGRPRTVSLIALGWADESELTSPLRTVSQFAIALWVFWTQAPLAFKARCFGGSFLRGSLRLGADVGFNFFDLQGEALSFEFTPDGQLLCWGGVYVETVSQPLLPSLMPAFSHLPDK